MKSRNHMKKKILSLPQLAWSRQEKKCLTGKNILTIKSTPNNDNI